MSRLEGRGPNGSGGINEQFVDSNARAGVDSVARSDQENAIGKGEGYIFYSTDDAGAGEESWYLQNDGRDLHVEKIEISTAASGIFTIMRQTSGTAAGTTMEGRNQKLGLAILDDVTAFGLASVTGSVDGEAIMGHDVGTERPYIFSLDGLIIPKGQALFVRTATAGIVHISAFVHIES